MNVDKDNPEETYTEMQLRDFKCSIDSKLPPGGGVLRKYLYGDAQSRLQNVDHHIPVYCKKKKERKKEGTSHAYMTHKTA